MPEAAILIVTHDSAAEIGPCLDAALPAGAEILVVDNASSDDTCRQVTARGVRFIANPDNRGFAAAVNQGMRALTAPFVLLLNPDARLATGLEPLCRACQGQQIAAACGKLVDAAGIPQAGFAVRALPSPAALICEVSLLNRIWPRNPINWHYRCLDFDFSKEADVEQPAAAFCMVRRDCWLQLNGFDENFYPVWFEDVDFCWRARERGYRIRYTPDAVAKHTGAHSLAKISLENRQLYWYGSLLRFAAKHYRPAAARIVALAVFLGAVPRMLLTAAASRSLKPIAAYGKVMAQAGRAILRPAG